MAEKPGNLASSLRLSASLALVTGTSDKTGQIFADWVETVTPAEGEVRFGASTSSDVARIAWRVDGDGPAILPGLGQWLADFGLPDDERERFTRTTAVLEPTRLGGVVEHTDGLDAGWYLSIDANVYDVLLLEKPTDDVDKVAAWCERHGAERCSRLLRSVGLAQSEIWIAVPGVGEKAMAVALDALDALVESRPLDATREALMAAAGGPVDVVTSHRDGGVTSVGVHVRRPSTAQVLALARSVPGRDELRLAAFEGALGVDGAAGAEYKVYAHRSALLLHYDVA